MNHTLTTGAKLLDRAPERLLTYRVSRQRFIDLFRVLSLVGL
jgi:hypothetical protein